MFAGSDGFRRLCEVSNPEQVSSPPFRRYHEVSGPELLPNSDVRDAPPRSHDQEVRAAPFLKLHPAAREDWSRLVVSATTGLIARGTTGRFAAATTLQKLGLQHQ